MLRALTLGLFLVTIGCSAGSGGGGDEPSGSSGSSAGGNGSAGSPGVAGSSSAGTSSGGSLGEGGSTATAAAGGASGSAGSAGTPAGGSAGSGGSGGTPSPSCTPGTGTESIAGGALLDKATCLIWEETPGFIAGGNWEPSRDYCAGLTLAGFDDWRMPTCLELASTPVAFIGRLGTSPRYLPDGTSDLANFHYCGVVHWSAEQPRGCGWVGPGNMDGTICVRGEAASALAPPDGCTCQEGTAGYSAAVE